MRPLPQAPGFTLQGKSVLLAPPPTIPYPGGRLSAMPDHEPVSTWAPRGCIWATSFFFGL